MTLVDFSKTLKGRMNASQLGEEADIKRILGHGDMVRAFTTFRRNVFLDGSTAIGTAGTAGTNKYVIAAAHSLTLADDAKGHQLLNVYARGGTGTLGQLTVDNGGLQAGAATTEPAAGHCAISANGDLLFNHTDAWTILDLEYRPNKYDVVELTLPVVPGTGIMTLPASVVAKGVLFLMEAESLAGTLVSKMIVQPPASAAPATTKALLYLAKATVGFAVADAVTSGRVKLAVASAIDVDALLEAPSTAI